MTTPKPSPGTYTITLDVDTSRLTRALDAWAATIEPLPDDEQAKFLEQDPTPPAPEEWEAWEYVYRIENSRHRGAYQTYGTEHIWRDDEARHPSPGRDGLGWINSREHFGFKSIDQLRAWFGEYELACLTLHNLDSCYEAALGEETMDRWPSNEDLLDGVQQLVLLRVPSRHVRHGGKQVCFHDEYADRIMTLPLDRDLIGAL